jgi:hypothetical protein
MAGESLRIPDRSYEELSVSSRSVAFTIPPGPCRSHGLMTSPCPVVPNMLLSPWAFARR